MKKGRIVFIVATVFFTLIASTVLFVKHQNYKSQTILNLTTEQKLSDFDALCELLDESYPFWDEVNKAGKDKDLIYATYRDIIKNTKTDITFFKEINYFLKEFQGFGHLAVLDGYMYRMYMDTLAVSGAMLTDREKQVVEVLTTVLTNPISQNTYGHLDQSHEGFRSTIGLKDEYKNVVLNDNAEEMPNLFTSIIEDKEVAYLKIQNFALTSYQDDQVILNSFFTEIKDIPHLVIDLRGNGGGSDLYWEDLLVNPNAKEQLSSERYYLLHLNETTKEYVSANGFFLEGLCSAYEPILSAYSDIFSHYTKDTTVFEKNENPYEGNIWILVDGDVYSAAENFAVFCKNTGFATLVGTTTGGDGGIADPMLFSLPNSGLIVRFSIFYGLNADGSGNEAVGTVPDVVIEEDEDALEKCLDLIAN